MSKLLYFGGTGTNDPTKAAFPFIGAKGALEAGIECSVALFGDAVVLMKDVIAENIYPVGWPPLKNVMKEVIDSGKVRVYVWGGCAVARGVTEADLEGKNASFTNPAEFAKLASESSVVSYWWFRLRVGGLLRWENRPSRLS